MSGRLESSSCSFWLMMNDFFTKKDLCDVFLRDPSICPTGAFHYTGKKTNEFIFIHQVHLCGMSYRHHCHHTFMQISPERGIHIIYIYIDIHTHTHTQLFSLNKYIPIHIYIHTSDGQILDPHFPALPLHSTPVCSAQHQHDTATATATRDDIHTTAPAATQPSSGSRNVLGTITLAIANNSNDDDDVSPCAAQSASSSSAPTAAAWRPVSQHGPFNATTTECHCRCCPSWYVV